MHRSNSEALHVAGHNGTLRHTSLNGWNEATISATAIHVEVAYLDEAARHGHCLFVYRATSIPTRCRRPMALPKRPFR
jgi:hypothetical protein